MLFRKRLAVSILLLLAGSGLRGQVMNELWLKE